MTNVIEAFDNYLNFNSNHNVTTLEKPAKVVKENFSNEKDYYLAKANEAEALEVFKEKEKKQRINLVNEKNKVFEEFKQSLFNQYSEYSLESLEKVFNRAMRENDQHNLLIAFEEDMEFIVEFNALN